MEVTSEMLKAVRDQECLHRGHSYVELENIGTDGPTGVMCGNCGRSWKVEGERLTPPTVVAMLDDITDGRGGDVLKALEANGYGVTVVYPPAAY